MYLKSCCHLCYSGNTVKFEFLNNFCCSVLGVLAVSFESGIRQWHWRHGDKFREEYFSTHSTRLWSRYKEQLNMEKNNAVISYLCALINMCNNFLWFMCMYIALFQRVIYGIAMCWHTPRNPLLNHSQLFQPRNLRQRLWNSSR